MENLIIKLLLIINVLVFIVIIVEHLYKFITTKTFQNKWLSSFYFYYFLIGYIIILCSLPESHFSDFYFQHKIIPFLQVMNIGLLPRHEKNYIRDYIDVCIAGIKKVFKKS